MANTTASPCRYCASLASRASTDYVSPREVAIFLRCSVSKLEAMRGSGNGPRFLKPTQRQVLYQVGDVLEWLAAHPKLQSTSDPAGALKRRLEATDLEGWLLTKPANRGANEAALATSTKRCVVRRPGSAA